MRGNACQIVWNSIHKLTVLYMLRAKSGLLCRAVIFSLVSVSWVFAAPDQPKIRPAAPAETEGSDDLAKLQSDATARPEATDSGPTPEAAEIASILGFPITNSMLVTWIVALGLIISAQVATRKMELVPSGLQNFGEWVVERLHSFLVQIIGRHLVERTFWLLATIFIFILAANWAGLIPGIGTIGWGHETATGFKVDRPLFRGATADLNLTLAMSLVFFASWFYWVVQEVGPAGLFRELFTGPKEGMSRSVDPAAGANLLCRGLRGSHFHSVASRCVVLPTVWQHLCRRHDARDHGEPGAGLRLAGADTVLLHGTLDGVCASDGLHVAGRGVHIAGVPTARRGSRLQASNQVISRS